MRFIAASFIIVLAALFSSCTNQKKTIVLDQQQDSLVVDSSTFKIDTVQIERIESIFLSKTEDIGWKFNDLWADSTIYPHGDTTKTGFRFQVSLTYPILAPASKNLDAIQKAFVQIISKSDTISIQKAFNNQVEEYIDLARSHENELNEMSWINYDQSYSISAEYISKSILVAQVFNSAYRGGAHNVFSINFYNITTNSGNIIDEEQLFKSGYKPKLAKLIQDEITRRNSCTNTDEHINLLGDLSDVNSNDNFYFENTGITYIYNVYEITGFAYGVIEIHLRYDKIVPLVKDKYLPLIASIQKEKIYRLNSISSEDGILQHE